MSRRLSRVERPSPLISLSHHSCFVLPVFFFYILLYLLFFFMFTLLSLFRLFLLSVSHHIYFLDSLCRPFFLLFPFDASSQIHLLVLVTFFFGFTHPSDAKTFAFTFSIERARFDPAG